MYSFIFIGRSGCGKGTQAELIKATLKEKYPNQEIFHLETGAEFREFIKGPSHTQKLSNEIYQAGGLQPEFLAVYIWANVLVREIKDGEHLIIDGTPRKLHEAGVLNSIFDFYKRPKPYVIHVKVGEKWATDRLLGRKRLDDNEEDIKKRLEWFNTDVAPTIEYYRNNPAYNFIEVDGERTIQEIHDDLVKRIFG